MSGRARHQLSDHISGEQPAVLGSRTRSGATISNNHGTALSSIMRSTGIKATTAEEESSRIIDNIAGLAAMLMPQVPASLLSPEPSNRSQVLASPERTLWEAAECSEMEGLIEGKVWEQVEPPEGEK